MTPPGPALASLGREQGEAQSGCHSLGKAESSVWAHTKADVAERCLSVDRGLGFPGCESCVVGYFDSEKLGWFL